MSPLSNELRSILERAIIKAREVAEEAAAAALSTLAVKRDEPFDRSMWNSDVYATRFAQKHAS